jgi:hypothetical protein
MHVRGRSTRYGPIRAATYVENRVGQHVDSRRTFAYKMEKNLLRRAWLLKQPEKICLRHMEGNYVAAGTAARA